MEEKILKNKLDSYNVEITKKYIGYLYEAMREYSDVVNKKQNEELRVLRLNVDTLINENEYLKNRLTLTTTHELFKDGLSNIFDKWNASLGENGYGKIGNSEHFYFIKSHGVGVRNSNHTFEDVLKQYENEVIKK